MEPSGSAQAEHEAGLAVHVMREIPSNVILAKAFAQRFDGFSIGSNNLTQPIFGVGRDSAKLAELFDEQDDAVRWMIESVITEARKAHLRADARRFDLRKRIQQAGPRTTVHSGNFSARESGVEYALSRALPLYMPGITG
jgi:hypothetical protein